jgi:hypothetical protein
MQNRKQPINHSSQVVQMRPVDPRKQRVVSKTSGYLPGQKAGNGADIHGGGGPENVGAKSSAAVNIPAYEARPAWSGEDNLLSEYIGYAAPSTTPNMAGIPANDFRNLGDGHGGRQ